MSEIEAGEYVRTDKGELGRVIDIKENPKRVVIDDCGQIILNAYIVKHSKDIIDLLEVGDYVNGYKIIMDLKMSKEHYHSKDDFVTAVNYTFEESEIKTIVTHEQMSSIEYKV